jgi:DNA-binding NtrC family response regulator
VRELENAMHRAVLLSTGPEIAEPAIRLPDGQPMAGRASTDPVAQTASRAAQAASAAMSVANSEASRGFVGLTVAEVEQQLIIDTLNHCFGNRTHAATILGISIRTLRNKLKEYSESGVVVPAHQGPGTSAA